MEKKFAARFKKGHLESNNGIAYFFRKQILIKQDIQRLKKLNDLLGEVKLILTKGLTKKLINGYSIFNGANHLAEDGLQNCFVFQLLIRYFKCRS